MMELDKFCDNTLCEAYAICYYVTDKGVKFYLCAVCRDAFELGQVNPDKAIEYPLFKSE